MFDLTLTFDNGPEPGVTPRVLDTLRERGISSATPIAAGWPSAPMTKATGSAITPVRTPYR